LVLLWWHYTLVLLWWHCTLVQLWWHYTLVLLWWCAVHKRHVKPMCIRLWPAMLKFCTVSEPKSSMHCMMMLADHKRSAIVIIVSNAVSAVIFVACLNTAAWMLADGCLRHGNMDVI